jgi:hypothetical protein
MSVEIKSGNSTDLATVDAASKAMRVTHYNSAGDEIGAHIPTSIACSDVTVVDNDVIASMDVSALKWVSIQLHGTWAGTVTFQESNNNGTFDNIVAQNAGDVDTPYSTTATANGLYKIPIMGDRLRVRVTAYTSGIVQAVAFGHKEVNDTGQISATGTVNISAGQSVSLVASAVPTPLKINSVVGVNATSVQAGPSNVGFMWVVSFAAGARYLKFYDKASAPVVGTDIPTYSFPLGAGVNSIPVPIGGFAFSTGFAYAILLSADDSGTTPFTVAGEVRAMLEYT